MTFNSDKQQSLIPYSNSVAVNEAIEEMEIESSGQQNGLYTRWNSINNAQLKYWRYNNIVGLAGASGAGKSALLNMIRTDFTDYEDMVIDVTGIDESDVQFACNIGEFECVSEKTIIRRAINKSVKKKALFLHFSFEMHPKKELLRTASSITGINYAAILSSYGIKQDDGTYTYEKLSESKKLLIKRVLHEFGKRSQLLCFNTTGNNVQIYNTVGATKERYPNYEIVVAIDHTLLLSHLNEKDDMQLQNNTIKNCINIRDDFGAMVIPLTQLNSDIEDGQRRGNKNQHYPVKKDIYMGGQFFQGCDDLYTLFAPAKIGISEYGPRSLPTMIPVETFNDGSVRKAQLIHLSKIKARFGKEGQLWLVNNLERGKIQNVSFIETEGKITDIKVGY